MNAGAVDPLGGYRNRTGRPPGRFLRALGAVAPGVARVRAQAEPYADAWADRNRVELARTNHRWVVLGDSMCQAVGATAYDAGWVDQLLARLGSDAAGLGVVNLSATGARVEDLLEQQLPLLPHVTDDSVGPALVTVLIGSNDLFAGGDVRRRLPEAFGRMCDELPLGTVVATLPQPREAARSANLPLEEAARRGRLRVVDMRTAGPSSWRGRLASDLFHPNDAGYAALADAFEPVVRRALRSG